MGARGPSTGASPSASAGAVAAPDVAEANPEWQTGVASLFAGVAELVREREAARSGPPPALRRRLSDPSSGGSAVLSRVDRRSFAAQRLSMELAARTEALQANFVLAQQAALWRRRQMETHAAQVDRAEQALGAVEAELHALQEEALVLRKALREARRPAFLRQPYSRLLYLSTSEDSARLSPPAGDSPRAQHPLRTHSPPPLPQRVGAHPSPRAAPLPPSRLAASGELFRDVPKNKHGAGALAPGVWRRREVESVGASERTPEDDGTWQPAPGAALGGGGGGEGAGAANGVAGGEAGVGAVGRSQTFHCSNSYCERPEAGVGAVGRSQTFHCSNSYCERPEAGVGAVGRSQTFHCSNSYCERPEAGVGAVGRSETGAEVDIEGRAEADAAPDAEAGAERGVERGEEDSAEGDGAEGGAAGCMDAPDGSPVSSAPWRQSVIASPASVPRSPAEMPAPPLPLRTGGTLLRPGVMAMQRVLGQVTGGGVTCRPLLLCLELGMLKLQGMLGATFTLAARNDAGNVRKVRAVLARLHPEVTVRDALADELARRDHVPGLPPKGATLATASAAMGLTWLLRSLHFCSLLIEGLLGMPVGARATSLTEPLHAAYRRSLQPFHGWLMQSVFARGAKSLPTLDALTETLCPGAVSREAREAAVREDLEAFAAAGARLCEEVGREFAVMQLVDLRKV